MKPEAKKSVLRMIPYGLYVLTSSTPAGEVAAATVNWVTQASFNPPLVVVAVKADSFIHQVIQQSSAFALNILGKGQNDMAYTFFKPAEAGERTISGVAYYPGSTGSPIIGSAMGFIECTTVSHTAKGDHTIFVGEVVDAGLLVEPDGRLDESTLWLRDLGKNIYYGG